MSTTDEPNNMYAPPSHRVQGQPGGGWWRNLLTDGNFQTVAAIWAVCLICWIVYLAKYASPLPWCDEYLFYVDGIATHDTPITWQFLWEPNNEHRQPLMRLWGALLGKVFNWDFRPMHYINTVILALSGLVLVLAVRKVRGRTILADVFLPLLTLTPFHYVTLLFYSHATNFAIPLALWCGCASAVLVNWPLQSPSRLLVYAGMLLAMTWSGGPVGSIWALGFCGILLSGILTDRGQTWKICAAAAVTLVGGSSALILLTIPPALSGGIYLSHSLSRTLSMAVKYGGVWMGDIPVWSWASWIMVLPGIYVLVQMGRDIGQQEKRERWARALQWFGMFSVLAAAVAIAVVLGHGRGNYPAPCSSRYCVFGAPIAIAIYLLLVRCSAPAIFTGALAIWMAVCVGWNLPAARTEAKLHKSRYTVLIKELCQGRQPLSLLAEQQTMATGWLAEWGTHYLVEWWRDMRSKGVSAYAKVHDTNQDPARFCILLHAASGTLGAGLSISPGAAVDGRSVTAATNSENACGVYEIRVPRAATYHLCCRWKATQPGQIFTVAVDEAAPETQLIKPHPGFSACEYGRPLNLSPGKHRLAITWPGPGSSMDVLELTPQ